MGAFKIGASVHKSCKGLLAFTITLQSFIASQRLAVLFQKMHH
jgi:hypothetical protein